MKKFVKIQSNVNIFVNAGVLYKDLTDKNSQLPDRLKIQPLGTDCRIEIKIGAHWYPSEVATFNGVKALQKDGLLTIGEYSDTCEDISEEKRAEYSKKVATARKKATKASSLEDISEEKEG